MRIINRFAAMLVPLVLASASAVAAGSNENDFVFPCVKNAVIPQQCSIFGVQQRGEVVVSFTVTSDGRVKDVKIVSSTNEALNAAARRTIPCWTFVPAKDRGLAVACKVTERLKFN